MELGGQARELFEALGDIPVIDAHEHLVPEARRVERKVDFSILFSHYTRADFLSAGMPAGDYQRMIDDESLPIEAKWELFRPYYPMIRHGSYARPARIWLKDVLGQDDITEGNFRVVSEQLQEANKPGLYDRVLRGMCNIRSALVDNTEHHEQFDMELLKPLWRITQYGTGPAVRQFVAGGSGGDRPRLTDYLDWVLGEGERLRRVGTFGLKMVSFRYCPPDRRKAEESFDHLVEPRPGRPGPDLTHLAGIVYEHAFGFAREHGLTVAVHSGVWGDFRDSHPCHLIPLAMAHPELHFDLFHLGMPFVREAAMVGKMLPNVSLNLCWDAVVSPVLTERLLDECIDMVPLNNLIAFGADYRIAVEKVYGHLVMAKEVVAKALAKRIRCGQMDLEEAVWIAKLWFHDNAVRIYGLQ